jgi:hypothetical protein
VSRRETITIMMKVKKVDNSKNYLRDNQSNLLQITLNHSDLHGFENSIVKDCIMAVLITPDLYCSQG